MRLAALACAMVGLAAAADAQVRPAPGEGNPHLQSVDYHPAEVVELEAAPGYELTVELSPDEQVRNVAVGDSGAWQVSVNHEGDHLFIKPSAAVATNMTVITTARVYNFELYPVPSPMPDTPYHVRFRYPDQPEAPAAGEIQYIDVSPLKRARSRYKVSGDRALRPDSVTNDGAHTYISWSPDKAIPAIYEITQTGQEALPNGAMRDDVYVVDGVPAKLVFRIDRREAEAVRLPPRKAH